MAVIRETLSDNNPSSAGNFGFFPLCNLPEIISYGTIEVLTFSFRPDPISYENICQHATEFFFSNISIYSSSVIGYFTFCK